MRGREANLSIHLNNPSHTAPPSHCPTAGARTAPRPCPCSVVAGHVCPRGRARSVKPPPGDGKAHLSSISPLRLVKTSRLVLYATDPHTHFTIHTLNHRLAHSLSPRPSNHQLKTSPSFPLASSPLFLPSRRPPREPTTQDKQTRQQRPHQTTNNHERRTTDCLRHAHRGPPRCQDPRPPSLQLCFLRRTPHGTSLCGAGKG
jgi:hypothetical protein